MGTLPACMYVHHMHAVPAEVRIRYQISWQMVVCAGDLTWVLFKHGSALNC